MQVIKFNRWLPVRVTLATLVFFSCVAGLLSLRWRNDLHAGVLRREAEAIHSVLLLQQASAQTRLADFSKDGATEDLFAAILESSRLRGVLAVRLFNPDGVLQQALPEQPRPERMESELMGQVVKNGPLARFLANGDLARVFDDPSLGGSPARPTPLLEVAVPLKDPRSGAMQGFAHYWIDGAPVAAEFASMDRGLAAQAGVIVLLGALGIAAISGWALHRLSTANRELQKQREDLAKANQELVLAAKTSAVGAISAHLIHGLKNPLAGLEGFVVDGSAANNEVDIEAWREAVETARRIRTLVNDVVAVLRDETAGAESQVNLREIIDAALYKYAGEAGQKSVQLISVTGSPLILLDSRVANLAGLVLANLVGNAVEASPSGACVTVDVIAQDHEVELRVADSGAGLPESVRGNLFRPLRSTKPGGSGIGLAISHQLARHFGGRLELVNSSDEGTVFSLVMPHH